MKLWKQWFECVEELRPAFSRNRTYLWAVVALAGMTARHDLVGVTSFVRSHWLSGVYYHSLRRLFHSSAVKLDVLIRLWVRLVLRIFSKQMVRVDGRFVLVSDGTKAPKEGRKMPAVKSLHQESSSNSKPTYIMGHSYQAISLLVRGISVFFAVPLSCRIHEGVVFSNRNKRTLLDKLIIMIQELGINQGFYLVADAYYASRTIAGPLLEMGSYLVSRVRSNAVAYYPILGRRPRKRGRPQVYGDKVPLRTLFDQPDLFITSRLTLYGMNVEIRYRTINLLWRPLGKLVRFVAVSHPQLGNIILISTNRMLDPIKIIELYALRFKIEVGFKQSIHTVGAFAYHFWMKAMKPIRRRSGNQYLHHQSERYRDMVKTKIRAYEIHVHFGLIVQGLLQFLSITSQATVWKMFRSWLRTMRPENNPSELVVAQALRHTLPEFLLGLSNCHILKKFLAGKLDPDRCPEFLLAS